MLPPLSLLLKKLQKSLHKKRYQQKSEANVLFFHYSHDHKLGWVICKCFLSSIFSNFFRIRIKVSVFGPSTNAEPIYPKTSENRPHCQVPLTKSYKTTVTGNQRDGMGGLSE